VVCRLRFSVLVPDDSHLSWVSEVVALVCFVALVCSGLLDGFAEAWSVVMALARESVERLAGVAQGESHSVALNHSVGRLDRSAEPAECSAGFHFQVVEYPAGPV
jgi:hypothetical protein